MGGKSKKLWVGKTVGRLTLIEESVKYSSVHVDGVRVQTTSKWACQCVCGNTHLVSAANLITGHTKSCGCISKEGNNSTHRMSNTPEYKAWLKMRERCLDENCKDYEDYGGRGIRIDPEWVDSFEKFYADMGSKPSRSHSLDRREVDGHHTTENCRWATPIEQANNKRSTERYEWCGEPMTLPDICRKVGVSQKLVRKRLKDFGWSLYDAVMTPKSGPYAARASMCYDRGTSTHGGVYGQAEIAQVT